jgi:hypothetical protein
MILMKDGVAHRFYPGDDPWVRAQLFHYLLGKGYVPGEEPDDESRPRLLSRVRDSFGN